MTAFFGSPARYVTVVLFGGKLHLKLATSYKIDALAFHAQVLKNFIADTTIRKGRRV